MKTLKRKLRRQHRALKWRQSVLYTLIRVERRYRKRGKSRQARFFHHRQIPVRKGVHRIQRTISDLDRRIERLEQQNDNARLRVVKWVKDQVGVAEWSAKHRAWAADLGYSPSLPWCSIFVGYALKHVGGFANKLPANPAYSGSWLTWPEGHRVSYANAQPGDLLIFDWGDGGITDHVAMFVGNGQKVGGNENNRVEMDAVPVANIVGVVRPEW